VRVLSLGAGVQSSTLLLMAVEGELDLDRAVFADTQWEPQAVYAWLEIIMPIAERAGIPVDVVTAGNIRMESLKRKGGFASLPLHILNQSDRGGMLRRQCTAEYKVRPIGRRLRALGARASCPVTLLLGISWDEGHRKKPSRVRYAVHEWPLLDRRMTRRDCLTWLTEHGYPQPPKSACIGCPFRDDRSWRRLRDEAPADWADAVDFDRDVRHAAMIKDPVYLHRSLVPLGMVDLSTPQEHGQLEMFADGGECDGWSCMAEGDIA
jgi:hypothetical protein